MVCSQHSWIIDGISLNDETCDLRLNRCDGKWHGPVYKPGECVVLNGVKPK